MKQKYKMDILILGLIFCALIAGIWIGQIKQAESDRGFFIKYISESCECSTKLDIEDGRITYTEKKNEDSWIYNLDYKNISHQDK